MLRMLLALCLLVTAPSFALAEEGASLQQQIDHLISARAGRAPVLCDDAEFLRRVTLDLAGRIPSATETRQFLAEVAPDKRAKLVDARLASPEYARRMQEAFHVLLMERLGEHPEWSKFLQGAFEKNLPWDVLVRALLAPNAEDPETRGSGLFLSKRLENYGQQPVDLPALTRDVGRLFIGIDLQCAQCHDHLFIDDYKQQDFQGLFTFVSQAAPRTDVKFPAVFEKPVKTKTDFMSVFVKEPRSTGPKLPGLDEVPIPALAENELFAVPPDKARQFPGVLKFSPLKILSEQLPRAETPGFSRNIVNRLWWLMLGRGLVHPLDLSHSGNPPSHPELLDLLSTEFAKPTPAGETTAPPFDIKRLLRHLALTQAYQATSRLPAGEDLKPELFVVALEKPLSAEQWMRGVLQATGPDKPLLEMTAPDEIRTKFLKAFANPPREPEVEFAPSVKAALFLMNDAQIAQWFKPQDGNLADRLVKLAEPPAVADELFLSVLSRPPAPDETAAVAQLLTSHPDKPAAVSHLIWGLLASTEFCVNH